MFEFPGLSVALLLLALIASSPTVGAVSQLSPEMELEFLRTFELNAVPRKKNGGDGKNGGKFEIPAFLIEQYSQMTGLEVDTANFRRPGSQLGFANTLQTFRGKIMLDKTTKSQHLRNNKKYKKDLLLQSQNILEFDFQHSGHDLQVRCSEK